nr:MAG TPA: CHAP domain protein [Caudoviricetes sp.]
MASADQVLAVAASQIGYSRWEDEEEGTVYGRWYAARTGRSWYAASGVAFCAMGVSWTLAQCGMEPPGGPFAYVPYGINNAHAAGALVDVYDAEPGDLVCFDWDDDGVADHVGFVELNQGDWLQTIEFNTSASSWDNGGLVLRRTRAWAGVTAMIRPAYDDATYDDDYPGTTQVVPDGWWGPATTTALQTALDLAVTDGVISSQDAANQDILAAAAGGWEFVPTDQAEGSVTITVLQRLLGVTDDGIPGPVTVRALQTRYGITPDGYLDAPSPTVTAMQRALAHGTL